MNLHLAEIAKTVVLRGLCRIGRRRASRTGDEPCSKMSGFVGLDIPKMKISVALAEEGRQGVA
jgi:hypothetical protein